MKNFTILIIGSIITIIMMLPSAFATSGSIELDDNEFTLYSGSSVKLLSIHGTIHDYSHKPILEISQNNVVIKTVNLSPIKNSLFTVLGLDRNWSDGDYSVNLIYQDEILDSKHFTIIRDFVIDKETKVYENMSDIFKSFIELDVEKLIIENNSYETITISGNLVSSQFGNDVDFLLYSPDNSIQTIGTVPLSHDGFFDYPITGIDKYWEPGKYEIHVKYLDLPNLVTSFIIENNYLTYPMEKEKLLGSFTLSSETSNNYTILGITGNVKTDESEIILQISKDDIVLFEDTLSINDNLFETNTVLYDYDSNTSWVAGDYRVSGLIGDESFYSDVFRLDEQNLSVFEISTMDLFLNFENAVQKMVDTDEIIISYGDQKQIILSGILDNYISQGIIDVHVVNPEGVDDVSYINASSDGTYYMPIMIDASWVSGVYTAYVTYGDFIDEPSSFEVVNNVIIENEILEEEISEIIVADLKNYFITLDNSKSLESVHFYAELKPYSGYTPITISLNDEIIKNEFIYTASNGFIDYYLLFDQSWDSGNYVVSYIENNDSVPFGTFEIFNTVIENNGLSNTISKKEQISHYLSFEQYVFKNPSHTVQYLHFSGKLVDDSLDEISVLLDGDLQTTIPLDSEGYYRDVISLDDNLDSGFHTLSISSGDVSESAEFLIATNHYISLVNGLEISRNTIAESGGKISVFLSKMVPDFIPSEVKPVIITIEGDGDYYQQFSVIPKGYGFYSQNFVIDETLGIYDVTVKYGDDVIESYDVTVILPEPEWIKSQTTSWLNGEINDYSYFKKIVLLLDENYEVTPNVKSPEWFVESADNWMNGLMDDDSFNDAILFLAENGLL
ncbi:hypothetical protein OAS49_04785 [Nitrosopumilus sp.]|nr:hypothetical protein [Nitrosopumilus sp.]